MEYMYLHFNYHRRENTVNFRGKINRYEKYSSKAAFLFDKHLDIIMINDLVTDVNGAHSGANLSFRCKFFGNEFTCKLSKIFKPLT